MFKIITNNRILLVFVMPFILGILSVLSFQPFNFFYINFLIFPVLFFILTYVNKRSKNKYRKKPYLKNLFYIGYLFGIGFFLSGTYWISNSLTFDDSFRFLVPFSIVLIPSFLAIFFGLSTLISGPLLKNNFISILIFVVILGFFDYIRSKLFGGFPWNLWAYSLSSFPSVLQLLKLIGFFSFNLLTITAYCVPILLFLKKKNNLLIFVFSLLIIVSNYFYGSIELNTKNKELNSKKDSINLKIISPNFDLKYNLETGDISNLLNKLIKYSDPNPNKKTLFIWPEGVFTGYDYADIKKFKKLFEKNFTKKHKILFGINSKNEATKQHFNSLVVVNNKFDIIYQYNKKKLVPFGEFLPFESFLHKLGLKKITYGFNSFSKGGESENFVYDGFSILPLICYEIIFPELIQSARPKANLIINISEDAWFGGTIGPHQHFSKAIFRAIENDTYIARSANQGISAFINNNGEIIKSLKSNEIGSIEMQIPFVNNGKKNKNDLIFFLLLFTYTFIFFIFKNKL